MTLDTSATKRSIALFSTLEATLNEVHNSKYSYDKAIFRTTKVPVVITCPIHGDFLQSINKHIRGTGCKNCYYEKPRPALPLSTFLKRAQAVHGKFYSYEKVEYTSIKDSITIVCPIHKEFTQAVYTHLRGSGCSKCATYGYSTSSPAILYTVKLLLPTPLYKVGITNRTVEDRFLKNELKFIEVLEVVEFLDGLKCLQEEQRLLKLNKPNAYKGDDVLTSGNTELFTQPILKEIS